MREVTTKKEALRWIEVNSAKWGGSEIRFTGYFETWVSWRGVSRTAGPNLWDLEAHQKTPEEDLIDLVNSFIRSPPKES